MQSHPQQRTDTPSRASILVIEDEQSVRGLFRAILEPVGYSIVEATDGQDGLRQVRQRPTDLVITDMYMPRGNGWTVIRELRAHDSRVKILAVAGAGRPETYGEALRLGATAMLKKPMSIGELRNAVARCLMSEDMKSPLPILRRQQASR